MSSRSYDVVLLTGDADLASWCDGVSGVSAVDSLEDVPPTRDVVVDSVTIEDEAGAVDTLHTVNPERSTIYVSNRRDGSTTKALEDGADAIILDDGNSPSRKPVIEYLEGLVTGPTSDPTREERYRVLERLYEQMADTSVSFDDRLRGVLADCRESLGLSVGALAHVSGDQYTLQTVEADGDDIVDGTTVPLSATYCERVIESEASLRITDVDATHPELTDRAGYTEFGMRCYLGSLVSVEGEPWGTLCFYDTEPPMSPLTEWDRLVVDLLASWVGHELEHEYRKAELEHVNAETEQLLERMDDAFFALDESWEFTYLNERAETLINPTGKDLVGKNVWAEFPEALGARFEAGYRRALEEQETVSFEEYFAPLETWFDVRAYPSQSGLSVFFTDITERKRREEQLERYETIVQTVDDGVFVIDEQYRFLQVNEAYTTLVGYDRDELLGESASLVVDDEQWGRWEEHANDLRGDARGPQAIEMPIVHRDGSVIPVEATATTISGGGSLSGFVCVVRDVTERKQREQTIRNLLETTQSLFDCETATEVAQTVTEAASSLFHFDVVSVRRYDSDQDALVLEWATEAVVEAASDRGPIGATESHIGEAYTSGETLVIDDVTESVAHRYGDVQSALILPLGENGVLTIGSSSPEGFDDSDVNLAKLLAQGGAAALQGANRRETLLQYEQVLETVEGMVFALDADHRLTLLTKPLADGLGYDRERLVGERFTTLVAPETIDDGERALEALVAGTDDVEPIELTLETATGSTFPVELEFSALPSSTGYRGAVCTLRDITERKERERYLQVLNRVLRHNLRNDLTVLIGYADHLVSELEEDDLADTAQAIHAIATDLSTLSENAKQIERVLQKEGVEATPVSLEDAVDRALEERSSSLEHATLEVDVSAEATVMADVHVIRILGEVIDNAIDHNPNSDQKIVATTTENDQDGTLVLAIEDNGTGIPESEQAILLGEQDITQLAHGSGLGLWLVRWTLESYGGFLRFDRSDLGGSRVELHFQRAP